MNWSENINELLAIAKNAGGAILEIYDTEDFGVEQKSDDSPLTKADKKANDIICAGLLDLFPNIQLFQKRTKKSHMIREKTITFSGVWIH